MPRYVVHVDSDPFCRDVPNAILTGADGEDSKPATGVPEKSNDSPSLDGRLVDASQASIPRTSISIFMLVCIVQHRKTTLDVGSQRQPEVKRLPVGVRDLEGAIQSDRSPFMVQTSLKTV